MTVDEAIKFCEKKHENISSVVDAGPYLHIEMMLKELKELRSCVKSSAFKDGYNKAIDDFTKALLSNEVVDKSVVRRCAEQLKV